MDLLAEINRLILRFPDGYRSQGIDAVSTHIGRAEKHWQQAKNTNDDELFTDVIYRTNQAFEGALKEAYSVLAGKDPAKKTPYEIEQYLEEGSVLKDRVLASLKTYRTEWRNPSAHNYRLSFTEQEALLAIANVSTFSIILLEQINTKALENLERERVAQFSSDVMNSIDDYSNLSFAEKVHALLASSYEFIQNSPDHSLTEYEFQGLLTGFIEAVDPRITVQADVLIDKGLRARADLIISAGEEKVLVEIKRARAASTYSGQILDHISGTLHHNLSLTKISNGVLMLFDNKSTNGQIIGKNSAQMTLAGLDALPNITYITPT